MNKEAKDVMRTLRKNGWEIKMGRRHPMAVAPDGSTSIPISLSPSDWRARKNLLNQIKKQYGPVPGLHT